MSDQIAIIPGQYNINILKEGRGLHRNLQVRVKPLDQQPSGPLARKKCWIDFPADRDCLELDGLDPRTTYEVDCRRRNILQRIRHHPQHRQIQLGIRGLRALLTGSGRCGTQTIVSYLDGLTFTDGTRVEARHEPLSEYILPALLEGQLGLVKTIQQGLGHNVEVAPYYALFPEAIHADLVIHLIRDGRYVVQSGLNHGWYQNYSMWNQLKPPFEGDPFTRACHFWRLTCEQAAKVASHTFRLEDLRESAAARLDLQRILAIQLDARGLPHLNRGHVPADYSGWDPEQRATFASIAGEVMDRYYPGWDANWSGRNPVHSR